MKIHTPTSKTDMEMLKEFTFYVPWSDYAQTKLKKWTQHWALYSMHHPVVLYQIAACMILYFL